ncbi:M18 family aminopeptidase [Gilvimarinus sp. F26214L]|uniref:M18 family aminopeptidase n=1 Tax=Gilvimarinus sp. DZF01 TaxID=3461371 RepID=UPI00404592E4
MNNDQFNRDLLQFIQASPTPFHAVDWMVGQLEAQGFQALRMDAPWSLQTGQRYYCTRNDSSIVAFVYGTNALSETGLRMVGAHTDSPCLRVKPQPEIKQSGFLQLGVEVYGGALLNPWFDRDLSLAGRVTYMAADGQLCSCLVNFHEPIAIIPSLAIHLDREVNSNRSINPQKDITPVACLSTPEEAVNLRDLLVEQMKREHPSVQVSRILDFELSFYDTQAPAIIGLRKEFIASARLDNLASCHLGLRALLEAGDQVTSMLVCNDHEEVGSQSAAGAQGPLVRDIIARLLPDPGERAQALERSMLISADNAHAVHPNYPDRHDRNHGPGINGGPVIKVNANQRYATNSEGSAIFQNICREEDVPVQYFVSRNDMPCGSTIGPLTATALGVATLDVGVPTFAMHSPRELAGTKDAYNFYRALKRFMSLEQVRI